MSKYIIEFDFVQSKHNNFQIFRSLMKEDNHFDLWNHKILFYQNHNFIVPSISIYFIDNNYFILIMIASFGNDFETHYSINRRVDKLIRAANNCHNGYLIKIKNLWMSGWQ